VAHEIQAYKDHIQPLDEAFIIHSAVDKDPLDFDQFMAPSDYYKPMLESLV
jgi:hypothetical protein